jgi:hypothetical protein
MKNMANTAILAVPDLKCYEFGLFIAEAYAQILGVSDRKFCKN